MLGPDLEGRGFLGGGQPAEPRHLKGVLGNGTEASDRTGEGGGDAGHAATSSRSGGSPASAAARLDWRAEAAIVLAP
jgi:hypothetical protein